MPQRHLRVSPATVLNHLLRASNKPIYIYVCNTVHLYVGIRSSGSFQHASFLASARISSAALIGIHGSHMTYLSPLSGHYRPTTRSLRPSSTEWNSKGWICHGQASRAHVMCCWV